MGGEKWTMKKRKKEWELLLGTISLSYFVHLESVIILAYLGWWGIHASFKCIIWSCISMASLIILIFLIWGDKREKGEGQSYEEKEVKTKK